MCVAIWSDEGHTRQIPKSDLEVVRINAPACKQSGAMSFRKAPPSLARGFSMLFIRGIHVARLRGVAVMSMAEKCRRKAAQWLDKAQAASDPATSESMLRAANACMALAQQMERVPLTGPRPAAPACRPADLAGSTNGPQGSTGVKDILCDHLYLSDDAEKPLQ
jgi:hypothetical protein